MNIVEDILGQAVYAPSGDNSQPWKFKVKKDSFDIFLVKKSDSSLYNCLEKGSFFAHGALVRNIEIIAGSQFTKFRINYETQRSNSEHIATVELHGEQSTKKHPLLEFVTKRCTNRKIYSYEPLSNEIMSELTKAFVEIGTGDIRFLENIKDEKRLLDAVSCNDRLIFENRKIHDTLFEMINWTDEEEKAKKRGFNIKALELTHDQEMAFRQLRKWGVVNLLNNLGLPKIISRQNRLLYGSSSAIGILIIKSDGVSDFINAGRAFQNLWLCATKLGVSVQPITGIPYLAYRIRSKETSFFSKDQVELVLEADEKIRSTFHVKDEIIAMLFRIGISQPPTIRSVRMDPVIV